MTVLTGKRGSGKTAQLVAMCTCDSMGIFVVPINVSIRTIEHRYPSLHGRVMSAMNSDSFRGLTAMLYIDNADLIGMDQVAKLARVQPIGCMTVSVR